MNKKKLIFIIIILLIVIALFTIVKYAVKGKSSLVNPGLQTGLQKTDVKSVSQSPTQPATPAFNPPKEINYGSATDLKQELDSINPQVLDNDFE